MDKKYIVPIVGRVYTNRNGGEYRCVSNLRYDSEAMEQRVLARGGHIASMERVKDGWTLDAHGILEYADGTIEWNYSTGGHFTH